MHFIARHEGHWVLRARKDDAIVDCWATTLDADNPIDFEVGNHYTATHPASPFVNRLTLRAIIPDGQVSVMNRDVTIVENGISRSERLGDRAALRALLGRHFGFDLPEVLALRIPSVEEWT
jgi:N-hydroxyarylamine O-acetyltransferase